MGNKIANAAVAVIYTAIAVVVYDMAAQTETGKKIINGAKSKADKVKAKCSKIKKGWN
jgi:hypothetical protein